MTQWKYIDLDNREVINELGETANVNSSLIQDWIAEGNTITPSSPNIEIIAQIIEKEESIGFTRKQREAFINNKIVDIENQIVALRAMLVK
jgi:hypothetical protein